MIRAFTPADKPQLLELLRLHIPLHFHESEFLDFQTYLDTEIEDYFVVERLGKIVGCGGINYFPEEQLARLSWDIIHPHYQGQGIGKELTLHRVQRVKNRTSINRIQVRTTQLVYEFYLKMNFTLIQTEKNYWAPGFDLYQMEMQL